MKKSPLQLDWVVYPSASYEFLEDTEGNGEPIAVDIRAEVTWDMDKQHMVSLSVKNREDKGSLYRFNVVTAALFTFDLDVATQYYKPEKTQQLPAIIAVNVCRILFSGAREQIAMMTARGPRGSAMIEGVIIEPSDVKISSTVEPQRILLEVFNVPEETVKAIEKKAKERIEANKMKAKKTPASKAL